MSVLILLSWWVTSVIWVRWFPATSSLRTITSSSPLGSGRSIWPPHRKPPSSTSTLPRLLSQPSNSLKQQSQEHLKKMLVKSWLSWNGRDRTTVQKSENLSLREDYWQDKASPMHTIQQKDWHFPPNGSIRMYITQYPWKSDSWAETTWSTPSKDSRSITPVAHICLNWSRSWPNTPSNNLKKWGIFPMKQSDFSTVTAKAAIIFWWMQSEMALQL